MPAPYLITNQSGGGLSVVRHVPEAPPEPPVDPNAVRWQAGGGILPLYQPDAVTPANWADTKQDMIDIPAFRFVQLRWNWNQLEPTEGGYAAGFATWLAPAANEIALLASGANRKRIMILLHIRHSDETSILGANDMVPDYMIGNATYGGGQWYFTTATTAVPGKGGKLICWWNAAVRAKFALFAAALGDYIDNYTAPDADGLMYHPFMGISISETATGTVNTVNTSGAGTAQPANVTFPANFEEKYAEGYYLGLKALVEATPHIMVGAFCNHDRNDIAEMIAGGSLYSGSIVCEGFEVLCAALGNPNTLPDDPGLRGDIVTGQGKPGVYFYYGSLKNKVPLTPSVQKPDYIYTKLGGTVNDSTGVVTPPAGGGGHHPTIAEIYTYAKVNLNANHIIWTRTDDVNFTYWNNLKAYLVAQNLANDPTMGLNTTPPSCYPAVTEIDEVLVTTKFFAGHGVKVEYDDQTSPSERAVILAEMAATPALNLMEYTLYWGEHETSAGNYVWTNLDAWKDGLAAIGKKMCITLAPKDFFKVNLVNRILPPDLRTTTGLYDGVGTDLDHMTYKYALGFLGGTAVVGYYMRLMPINDGSTIDSTVQDRYAAFIQALVARYDTDPTVVLITCTESALGTPALAYGSGTAGTPGGTNRFLTARGQEDGQDNAMNVAKLASVRTPVIHRLNFTFARILRRINTLPGLKIGLGCPDCNEQAAINGSTPGSRGILDYYPANQGIITLMSEVQPDTYEYQGGSDKTGTELPSYQTIYERAKNTLGVNILVWQRSGGYWEGGTVTVPDRTGSGSHSNTAPSVLTFLQTHPAIINGGISGGLPSSPPVNWL